MGTSFLIRQARVFPLVLFILILSGCSDDQTGSGPDTILSQKPNNTQCIPSASSDIGINNLGIPAPIAGNSITALKQAPGASDDWFVVQQGGRIYKLASLDSATTMTTYLDLTSEVTSGFEQGLLGLAFHPNYPTTAQAFVTYSVPSASAESETAVRLSRFTESGGVLNPASEEILLQHDKDVDIHYSGSLAIGPDNYLYVSFGDDTHFMGNPVNENSQDPFKHFGKILRLDVSGTTGYTIPGDNPFASGASGAPEVFLYGLRNPWQFHVDEVTSKVWIGDVGGITHEEINVAENGDNLGWPIYEAETCYIDDECDTPNLTGPVHFFDRSVVRCIIGGLIYRGSGVSGLAGKYLSGDCFSGTVYVTDPDDDFATRILVYSGVNINTFAQDKTTKDVYIASRAGEILALSSAADTNTQTSAYKLSETNCIRMDKPNTRKKKVSIPYRIRFPFWSDGAVKTRFVALPKDVAIKSYWQESGSDNYYRPYTFRMPKGTVLIKNFKADGRFIETRLLKRHYDGNWRGYSYEWNDEQTEAFLLDDAKLKDLPGGKQHYYPSQSECAACHREVAGSVLGFNPYQLDLKLTDGSETVNQLRYLRNLDVNISDFNPTPEFIVNTSKSNIEPEEWMNGYLQSNCSFCHQPATNILDMDFRLTTSLHHLIGKVPNKDLGITGAQVIVPQDPELSLIYNRVNRKDDDRMPFIGNLVKDNESLGRIREYINSLPKE